MAVESKPKVTLTMSLVDGKTVYRQPARDRNKVVMAWRSTVMRGIGKAACSDGRVRISWAQYSSGVVTWCKATALLGHARSRFGIVRSCSAGRRQGWATFCAVRRWQSWARQREGKA